MNALTKTDLRSAGGIAATVGLLLGGGVYYSRLAIPDVPTITLAWDCPTAPLQTFQFIRSTNLTDWQVYTNIVGTNHATLPRTHPHEFFTIGATWWTSDTNDVLRWEGW